MGNRGSFERRRHVFVGCSVVAAIALFCVCGGLAEELATSTQVDVAAHLMSRLEAEVERHETLFHRKASDYAAAAGVMLPGEAAKLSHYDFATQATIIEKLESNDPAIIDLIAHSYHHRFLHEMRRQALVEMDAKRVQHGSSTGSDGVCKRQPMLSIKNPGVRYSAHTQELQRMLQVEADGKFGSGTKAAVKAFQQREDLDDDGIVGPATWAALCNEATAEKNEVAIGAAAKENQEQTQGVGAERVIAAARKLRDDLRKRNPGYGTSAFNGYGSGHPDKYVCTTYVSKVLRNAGFGFRKGGAVDREINIRGLGLTGRTPDEMVADLARKVKAGEPKTKGVVYALTKAGWGTEIQNPTVDTVAPGDLCQYWYSGGKLGHVVIVDHKVEGSSKVKVIGSHGVTKGVDLISISLPASKSAPTYCVRPKSPGTGSAAEVDISEGSDEPADTTSPGDEGDPVPSAYDERVEALVDQGEACATCKQKFDDWQKDCTNECSLPPASDSLGETVKTVLSGLLKIKADDHCKTPALTMECMEAYLPHMTIVGGNLAFTTLTGGFEFVTDYNTAEIGLFVYGGLSISTNIFTGDLGATVYGGVGWKGKQSKCCCSNPQDLSGVCRADRSQCPCSLENSYKGYFLGADVGGDVYGIGVSAIAALSATALFEDFDLDKTWLSGAEDSDGGAGDVSAEKKASNARRIASTVGAVVPGAAVAPFFMTKPLTHLTKTLAIGVSLKSPSGFGAGVASTYYKFVGSFQCGDSGPGCFAGVLAISPPFPGSAGGAATAMKVIQWTLFVNRWCEKPANADSFTCKAKDTLDEVYQFWAEKGLVGGLTDMWEQGSDFVSTKLDKWQRNFNHGVRKAHQVAAAWLADHREKMDKLRALAGDVSPEKKKDKVYEHSQYFHRAGTYLKLFDCDGNIHATTTNGVMWNDHQENTDPYFKCRWCQGSTCHKEITTEVGVKGTGPDRSKWYWRWENHPNNGFGMFWDGREDGSVHCTLWERNRGVGDNEFGAYKLVFRSRDQVTDINKPGSKKTTSGPERGGTTCRYIYFSSSGNGVPRFRQRSGEVLLRRHVAARGKAVHST